MKKKLMVSIVLVLILIPCTINIAGKQNDLPDQASLKKSGEDKELVKYIHFQDLAAKLYEQNGWVPEGILEILSSIGR
jgi:hypothetical protein